MAVLKKFKALKPKKGLEEKIASLPYDVISSEEARPIAEENPYSFLHIIKPEVDLPAGTDLYSQEVYEKAKENFDKFIKEGLLIQEDSERLYIYRQTMKGRDQYGIVGCVSAQDYENDIIKKHEFTRPAKERDRIKHVDITNSNAGPVFLTYKAREPINNVVAEVVNNPPLYDFIAADGIKHTIWIVDDHKGDALIKEFDKVDYLYVADGHHRTASAAKVAQMRKDANPNHTGNEEYNFFLAVLFPHNQLQIIDYNRVLKNLNNHSKEELFNKLKEIFSLEKKGYTQYKPAKKGEIGMYMDKEWYKLTLQKEKVDSSDPVKSLDISILQNYILGPFFGIDDPRTSDQIDFIGGIRGLEELERLVDGGNFKVAFALYPVSIEELIRIADAGKVMPPKSTWFEPKLRSGLLIHLLEN